MGVLKDLFNDPVYFFKGKRSFKEGFAWMLVALFVFVSLNQLMIEMGFVVFERDVTPLNAILINFVTLVAGFFVLTAVSSIPFRLIGGKDTGKLFMVVAYSMVPVIFLWIPHIIAQSIIIFLSMIIMTKGVSRYSKAETRKSLIVTITFLALVILSSTVVQNSLLLFGNFNILPS